MSLRGSRIGDAGHFLLGGADGYGGGFLITPYVFILT